MSRPVFSFRPNMEYPEHQKAWEILKNVPEGQKSLFLVQAILQKDQAQSLEKMIRRAVREELDGVRLEKAAVSAGPEGGEQEIPGRMLDFLLQIE